MRLTDFYLHPFTFVGYGDDRIVFPPIQFLICRTTLRNSAMVMSPIRDGMVRPQSWFKLLMTHWMQKLSWLDYKWICGVNRSITILREATVKPR